MKHASTGRLRVKVLVSATAVLCSAIALLAAAAPASAAQPQGPRGNTLAVTDKISPVSALGVNKPAVTSAVCAPALNKFDRTQVCWGLTITFTFFQNGRPVGTLVAGLVQSIHLNAGGTNWTENDTVVGAVRRGTTAPVDVTLTASCHSPCHARAHFRGVVRVGLRGTVAYTDGIARSRVHTTGTHYILDYVAPPYIPLSVLSWNSPISYRCDDNMPGIAGRGCVFPKFTPTFAVSRAAYGASAAMIEWAQQNLSAHWGLRGRGKPLTRLANSTKRDANRKVICRRGWHAFGPWIAGKVKVGDSCDEFPFASTYQSGAMHGVSTGAACAQVKAVQTSNTGSDAKIWNSVTPIGKPNHNAKCVRGHIPITLNTDLGSNAYFGFIKSERVLDKDPFWLAVTA